MKNTERVKNELEELIKLGEALTARIEEAQNLYKLLDDMQGIEKAELKRLIRLCEGDSVSEFVIEIKELAAKRVEGYIYLASNSRYRMKNDDHEFTSGCGIEVYIDDKNSDDYGWNFGCVEYSNQYGGYYFYNMSGYDHYQLKAGMLVARRIKKWW